MPFGLCNAAQTFQRLIDEVLRGVPGCYAYIDDILFRLSKSSWASPIYLQPMGDPGEFRLCGDYRRLNKMHAGCSKQQPTHRCLLK